MAFVTSTVMAKLEFLVLCWIANNHRPNKKEVEAVTLVIKITETEQEPEEEAATRIPLLLPEAPSRKPAKEPMPLSPDASPWLPPGKNSEMDLLNPAAALWHQPGKELAAFAKETKKTAPTGTGIKTASVTMTMTYHGHGHRGDRRCRRRRARRGDRSSAADSNTYQDCRDWSAVHGVRAHPSPHEDAYK